MSFNIQTKSGFPLKAYSLGSSAGEDVLAVADNGISLGTTQVIALSATAQASSAWGSGNGVPARIRVIGSSAFYMTAATAPVASSASPYFGVSLDGTIISVPDGQKLSVLQAGSGGNVWITVVG